MPRRLTGADLDIVAVEGDVDRAEGYFLARELLNQPAQPVRKRDASRVDADEGDAVEVRVALDDLVSDSSSFAQAAATALLSGLTGPS